MSAAAAPQGTGRMDGIGKKELAAALGWSRPKLDRRLLSDPNFPVLNRGDQSGGWKFDLAGVQTYLDGRGTPAQAVPAPSSAASAIDLAQLRDAVAPPTPQPAATVVASPGVATPPRKSAHHVGEASAKQRKDEAEAKLKELKLGELLGEYMLRVEAEQVAAEVFVAFAGELDAAPEDILKARGMDLSGEGVEKVRKVLDGIRFTLHQKLAPMLERSEAPS